MAGDIQHPKDELQELLDGRLDAQRRALIERHLESCEACRRELAGVRWVKEFASTRYGADSAPPGLAEGVGNALDGVEREPGVAPALAFGRRVLWVALAAVVLAAAALTILFSIRSPDLPRAVARDYRDYMSGRLSLDLTTDDVRRMEGFFAERGIGFETRVFDLGMMRYGLVGGRIHRLGGREIALFVYRGEDGRVLVCQMYRGTVEELPQDATRRSNNEIDFYIFREGELTLVFWQEGAVTCVLVSDAPSEEVVQLAFGKAVKL